MPEISKHRLLTSEWWDIQDPEIRNEIPYDELDEIFEEKVKDFLGLTHRLQDDEQDDPESDPYIVRYYELMDVLRKICDRIKALEEA